MRLRYLGFVAAALALATPGYAVRSADSAWRLYSWQRQTLVEQQTPGGATQPDPSLWVTNPTSPPPGCVWDADDEQNVSFSGTLNPGDSVSFTRCLIADWHEHISWVRSDTDGVTVTLTVGPVSVSGGTVACVVGPDYDVGSSKLQPVEGSNGGVGLFTDVTFTVTNTLHRKIRRVSAFGYLGFYLGDPYGCALGDRFGFDPAWRMGSG